MAIQTRTLGRTGADVTILGYGAMELRGEPRGPQLSDEHAGKVLNAVLDGGITLIDTSPDYGRSEELIGRYVGRRRDEFFLASKCGCPLELPAGTPPPYPHDYSPANVRAAVERSLTRLGTDRLDLVQVHMSPSNATMAANDVIETLFTLQRDGKTRFIGMSGILPDLPDHIALGVFDVFQIPYSAVQREHEDLITQAAGEGAGTLIRGGAARGAPAEDKNWQAGPLGLAQGEGQRRWQSAGLDETHQRQRPVEDRVHAALHPQPPRPDEHHRRHVKPGPPDGQPRHRREGAAPARRLRGGEKTAGRLARADAVVGT